MPEEGHVLSQLRKAAPRRAEFLHRLRRGPGLENDFLKALKDAHVDVDPDITVIIDRDALPEKLADEQIPDMQTQLDAARERYLRLIPADADAWTAARIVHDEMVRSISLDKSERRPHGGDIYGALVENTAVCLGYACAFSYIMTEWERRCADESPAVSGGVNSYRVVESDDHAWNDARLSDGDDRMIDVTWDDTDWTDAYGEPYVLYNYFGLTREEIETIDSHEISGQNQPSAHDGVPGQYGSYHRHEGYYLTSFDLSAVASVLAGQYSAGKNVLTVRFERQEDYARIKTWTDSGAREGRDILSQIGYTGAYLYTWMDGGRIFNILLNCPET